MQLKGEKEKEKPIVYIQKRILGVEKEEFLGESSFIFISLLRKIK